MSMFRQKWVSLNTLTRSVLIILISYIALSLLAYFLFPVKNKEFGGMSDFLMYYMINPALSFGIGAGYVTFVFGKKLKISSKFARMALSVATGMLVAYDTVNIISLLLFKRF